MRGALAAGAAVAAALLLWPAAGAEAAGADAAARPGKKARSQPRCRAIRRPGRPRCARMTARRSARGRERLTDLLAASPRGAPPAPAPAPPAPGPPGVLQNVGVTADEFTLQLSRPGVPRGRVRVAFRNAGEDPHDLQVREEAALASVLSFPALPPAGEARQAASLPAGRYLLWCSLEGHADLGMRTTLQVW